MKKAKIMQKKAQKISYEDLMYKYRLLSYLMDHAPDVIYFKDKKGRLVLVNQAHAKGLGVKPEDVAGKTDFDFFPKERAEAMMKDDMYVIKTGKPIIDKVERATRPDGVDNYVSTTKIPMIDEKKKTIGLIGITRDITRRMQFEHLKKEKARIEKKLEVLQAMDGLKTEFISTISHELRTPLAIIKQLVMLIFNETAGPINDKQKEILKKGGDNIERLRSLIDELLDISRIERDKLRLHYTLVNFIDLLKDSSDFFKRLAQEKAIDLKYYLPQREINIFIDADRISQVISNLISNAIKFTEGGGEIRIEVKVLETKVRVGVIDTGIGINKSDLPLVFNKFMQVSRIGEAEKKGVGLGLSIVKELVERHKGEIWAESKLGVGSRFYFTLPRFYRPNILDRATKEKINNLLNKGVSVQFINLLIVNYKEFKKRVMVKPKFLFKDLKLVIEAVLKGLGRTVIKNPPITLMDSRNGKCTIILPGLKESKVTMATNLLKDKIGEYFVKNRLESTFITLGVLAYSQKVHLRTVRHLPAVISTKDIYIGSEKRRFRRVYYRASIKILLSGNKVESSQTVDISRGGICFVSRKLLKTDSEVKIKLDLPKSKEIICAETRVAWIKKIERLPKEAFDKYRVGLEFVNLKDKYKKVLSRELKI